MLPCYVLLDLETTGGSPVHDRITEIAAVRIEGGQEVARWSTLVNPGVPISSFIENLTGISDKLVADAPTFADVAPHLLDLITGAVLVAHNVRFDHGFLVNEFARLATPLHLKTLCTVRLSRLLYPQYKSHGLDAIMQRHGLTTSARHRAMGDVEVMLAWLTQATEELGADPIRRHAQALLQTSASLPPQLETPVGDIPESAGVYVMYGEATQPLFVGKSSKLRSRVLAHFQTTSKDPDDLRLAKETRRIEWIETAGELGTLLLDAYRERDPEILASALKRQTLTFMDNEVVRLAKSIGHEQVPAIYDQAIGDFYFQRNAGNEVTPVEHFVAPKTTTSALPASANPEGKYRSLVQTLHCPKDQASYGTFREYGYWAGGPWCEQQGLPGYWIWVAPNWYIWEGLN